MQTLHAAPLNGVVPVQYPIIQGLARNKWIDVNNESAVTLQMSLGGRPYLIPPNTTARYAMDNTETFVTFTPQSAADPTRDSVSGTIYNEQDSTPIEIERGANASDILPVTSVMIADGAIVASKVAIDAINTANIIAGAVGTAELANGAVTNPILAALAVNTVNIQAGAVTNTELGAGAVATGNIQSGAVTNPLLAALAVANANIQANAVAATQIATGAVTTTKIANLAVTRALIAGAAIGTAQIANAAITTALIANLAVTDALIASLGAGKITAGTITASISITSPTITTNSTGQRVEITETKADRITFYSGLAGEVTAGFVSSTVAGTTGGITMVSPNTGVGGPFSLSIGSDGTGRYTGARLLTGNTSQWSIPAMSGVGSVLNGSFSGLTSVVIPKIQSGTGTATSSLGGDFTITFPSAFPTGLITIVVMSGDVAAFSGYFAMTSSSASAAVIRAMNSAGSVATSTTLRYNWIAIGW